MRRVRGVLAWLSLVWTGCFQDQSLPEGESGGTETGGATSAQTDGASSSASTSSTSSDTTPTSTSASSTPTSSSPTSTSPTETSAASDTSVECPDGEVCLEGVDAGWQGPVAIMLGSDAEPPAMCPAGWEPRPSHFADLDVSPFACECACPDVAAPTCEYLVTFYSGPGCDGDGLASQAVGQGDCTAYLGSDAHS